MSEERLKNTVGRKDDRTVDDRPSRTVSLEDLDSLLSSESITNVLPKPPVIPGYHTVWLSTTNANNPISMYESRGYSRVVPEDLVSGTTGGQEFLRSAASDDTGIRCNEMILYKVDSRVYHRIMTILHHDEPLRYEEGIHNRISNELVDEKTGRSLAREIGEGMEPQKAPAPLSFE